MRKTLAALTLAALCVSTASAKPDMGPDKGHSQQQAASHGKPAKGPAKVAGPDNRPDKAPGSKNISASAKASERASHSKFEKGPIKQAGNGMKLRNKPERDGVYISSGKRILKHRVAYRELVDGCPPGLAKKFNGCMPPGLAKKRYSYSYYRPDWWGFSSYPNGRYYYHGGFLFRLGRDNRISAFIPLLAGALGLGSPWPAYYEPRPLAPYYVDYYRLGPPRSYRYADRVVYRVDPETAVITSIVALMTGDRFVVGRPMPPGYGVYNVPFAYRDRYYDSPRAHYRYADGYIYEIDPETLLIASAISLAI